jgi:hypothetical protein
MSEKCRPGQLVVESGVYRVVHNSHRLIHQVTLLKGTRFPECKRCGGGVRFEWLAAGRGTHIGSGYHAILQDFGDEPSQAKKRPA